MPAIKAARGWIATIIMAFSVLRKFLSLQLLEKGNVIGIASSGVSLRTD
jgi:hypothetical protein